tara:strand:- start:551 stop:811 length:261 start_codon:yes stop_codon:yes gene_type:complete
MNLRELEEAIQSDIVASIGDNNFIPLSIYRYTKDDLHLLLLERFDEGVTIEAAVDYVIDNWEDEIEATNLRASRDILITRYEEFRG